MYVHVCIQYMYIYTHMYILFTYSVYNSLKTVMRNQNWLIWKKSFLLWSSTEKQLQKAFDLLSLAQLSPAQWGAPILVRHEALNQCTHAVSSQPALMALPVRTKAEDRSQPLSIFVQFVILSETCAAFWGSLCAEWAGILTLPLTFSLSSFSPPAAGSPLFIFPQSIMGGNDVLHVLPAALLGEQKADND